MRTLTLAAVLCTAGLSASLAHEGVKNAAVLAWMESMKTMGARTKVIGRMATGETAFDVEAVRAALGEISVQAKLTPELFETREDDPNSEASPEIWENFADFTVRSERLHALAGDWASRINGPDDLAPLLSALGDACKGCHGPYRE